MFMGHQNGTFTKENIKRNLRMPTTHVYRKALRMMYFTYHHGFPIFTCIYTLGAFADLKSEKGVAIAHNLRTMIGLKVPIVSTVIGVGGYGGALPISCGNNILIPKNVVFYAISLEDVCYKSIFWIGYNVTSQVV